MDHFISYNTRIKYFRCLKFIIRFFTTKNCFYIFNYITIYIKAFALKSFQKNLCNSFLLNMFSLSMFKKQIINYQLKKINKRKN